MFVVLTMEALLSYLSSIDILTLSHTNRALLDREINVASFLPFKSPGLDGFLSVWYQTYDGTLGSCLRKVCVSVREGGSLLPSMRGTLIVLLPKTGKDVWKCDSYCPISLMNTDTKILAKVLSRRLQSVNTTLFDWD